MPLPINAELQLYRARVASYESKRCVPQAARRLHADVRRRASDARRSAAGPARSRLEEEASAAFARALALDPTDGRGYLGLAKAHERAGRVADARRVLEDGTRATRGENAFLWQAWAVLEERAGDVNAARRLYDAATVADKRHAAAWHGWGMLEKCVPLSVCVVVSQSSGV